MPDNQPPGQPKPPDTGEYYKQVSDDDPLADTDANTPTKFDFMLKQQPKPQKSKFSLPSNKPVKILLIAGAVLVVAILMASIFGGGGNDSKKVIDLIAQSQEVIRISQLEDQQFKDANTKNLSATTQMTLESQQTAFAAYLKKNKVKYGPKDLAIRTNKTTDAQLQIADQNNNLEDAYALYLSNTLTTYQNSMNTLYKSTKSTSLKTALQSAFSSVGVLLRSPQFPKNAHLD